MIDPLTAWLALSAGALAGMSLVMAKVDRIERFPSDETVAAPMMIASDHMVDAGDYAGERWVEQARTVAAEIAKANNHVTADDVWKACPPPEGVDGRLLAKVFTKRDWELVGRTPSARGRNQARQIAVWKRREAA